MVYNITKYNKIKRSLHFGIIDGGTFIVQMATEGVLLSVAILPPIKADRSFFPDTSAAASIVSAVLPTIYKTVLFWYKCRLQEDENSKPMYK